jgi:hypothetical protein
MADAFRRRQERQIEEWKQQRHTVMETVGGEPTGLIVEMLGADILRKNSEMLVIYLAQMGNWNSYGNDPKPRLRKFITPREFRLLKFNERKAALKAGSALPPRRSSSPRRKESIGLEVAGRDSPTRVHFT